MSFSSTLIAEPPAVGRPRRVWLGWLVLLSVTLWWDASGLDRVVMAWLGDASGFPWRHHVLLETVLHDRARQVAVGALFVVAVLAAFPWGPLRRLTGRQRLTALGGVLLALLAVNLIKNRSATSCPWDVDAFGGSAVYVSHWAWFTPDGGPGRCFPGGHASAAFAFLALAWPWLDADRPGHRRIGWVLLTGVVGVGVVFGAVQTLRGAHYPSHTLWTAVICAGVTWGCYRLLSRWTAPRIGV